MIMIIPATYFVAPILIAILSTPRCFLSEQMLYSLVLECLILSLSIQYSYFLEPFMLSPFMIQHNRYKTIFSVQVTYPDLSPHVMNN